MTGSAGGGTALWARVSEASVASGHRHVQKKSENTWIWTVHFPSGPAMGEGGGACRGLPTVVDDRDVPRESGENSEVYQCPSVRPNTISLTNARRKYLRPPDSWDSWSHWGTHPVTQDILPPSRPGRKKREKRKREEEEKSSHVRAADPMNSILL